VALLYFSHGEETVDSFVPTPFFWPPFPFFSVHRILHAGPQPLDVLHSLEKALLLSSEIRLDNFNFYNGMRWSIIYITNLVGKKGEDSSLMCLSSKANLKIDCLGGYLAFTR
jgi:hypothetical protein